MKKCMGALLMALCLIAGTALAEVTDAELMQRVHNWLTEVYGYSVEEADAFEIHLSSEDGQRKAEYWPADHPEWVYTAFFDGSTGENLGSTSPFKQEKTYGSYPGESTVRWGLQTARAKGWFTSWTEADRSALIAWMLENGVQPTPALQEGAALGTLPAGNALREYFVSCYGAENEWPEALSQWLDAELARAGLSLEKQEEAYEGLVTYETGYAHTDQRTTVTRFAGEVHVGLQEVLAHPRLQGWTLLCGALMEGENDSRGLLAFEKNAERLLVQLNGEGRGKPWTVYPVGTQALYADRELYITCDAQQNTFDIVYPVTDTISERFTVRRSYADLDIGVFCRLAEYSRLDAQSGEGVRIQVAHDGYTVVTMHADGRMEESRVEKTVQHRLDLTPITAFPTTLQSCWQTQSVEAPEGYGVAAGPHLRRQTSSRSRDLGEYYSGALVKVLEEAPGDPYSWYRVLAGSQEGYMCSLYVDYEGSVCSMEPLTYSTPLPVAAMKCDGKLKSGAGRLAPTVQTLQAGTQMHVLAECGDWLHVMVPSGEMHWMMDVNGTDGYVKKSSVVMAATQLQLEWKQE